MQFCGFSNQEALTYWEKCAAGDLTKYKHIKTAILKFKPFKEFAISNQFKKQLCECTN